MNNLTRAALFLPLLFLLLSIDAQAQTGEVRGSVFDKETGEPIIFTPVYLQEIMIGKATDINGFFAISKIKPGTYTLKCYSIGYDSAMAVIAITEGHITTQNLYLKKVSTQLKEVEISGEREKARNDVKISNITITQKELRQLPSFGGEPDLAQYLQILPGAVFSGDQGGQLYIRGGPPVQNKILLDGMIIYNPFHSIGLFSVFDADIIRSADVYAGGFNAQYGGRIGSIIDVTTREGNKKEFGGKISVNPITAKILLEGPISKFTEGGGSSSIIVSYKTSYLDKTSKIFYPYADPNNKTNGLPYSFNDVYGKYSFVGAGGSKVNVFGFYFGDNANYPQTQYNWNSYGFGSNFFLIPEGSTIINGTVAYSNYKMQQTEADAKPRNSGISGFNIAMNFTNFIGKDDIKYGFEVNGFGTTYNYVNSNGILLEEDQNTTELCGFIKYKKNTGRFIIEPGLRAQAYASLSTYKLEPRFGIKYNMTDKVRLKASAGYYTQNLMSATSDQDVVNLFYGFLSGPEDNLSSKAVNSLQMAWHYVGGVELDVGQHGEVNIEGFYKDFTQLLNINRDKVYDNNEANQDKPEDLRVSYIVETGKAYGGDFRYKYEFRKFYLWAVYSLTYVTRNDGKREYFPSFDRRHNINLVGTYSFGKNGSWNFNARWNFGSGFPFTQTQGNYEQLPFTGGVSSNYINQNGQLAFNYTAYNTGRLPYFHRLDLSLSKKIKIKETQSLTITAACTNVYDRSNIFYFNRATGERVNQLPIMPTLGINYSF